jgi:transposase InsO family protein
VDRFINHDDQSKLEVAELSKILKNVSKIYLHPGPEDKIKEYQEMVRLHGLGSIEDIRPALPRINRQAGRPEIFEAVSQLSLEHPGWGCEKLSEQLKNSNINISPSAVYNILVKRQLGRKNERLVKLTEIYTENIEKLSPEQIAALEKFDPAFKERQIRGKQPGELLAQDTIFIGFHKNLDEVYLQIVVDSYSSYAFGFVHLGKSSDYAVAIVHNEVLPFFKKIQIPLSAILTDNGREYCGKDGHHYELYLQLNNIEHAKTATKQCSHFFIKQFKKIIMNEFIRQFTNGSKVDDIEKVQYQLEEWLNYYNRQRPFHGFPNNGNPPVKLISKSISIK